MSDNLDRQMELSAVESAPLRARLRELGVEAFTEVQRAVIPAVLGGANVLVSAPTGSGKTLAYLVPVLQQLQTQPPSGIGALILAPTQIGRAHV